MPEPGYLTLHRRGELIERAEKLERLLSPCRLCPWECGAERTSGHPGRCRSTNQLKVSSTNLHFGEEPPISGQRGSGTIFLTNCTLRCLFCQNYPISHMGNGVEMGAQELADEMVALQKKGAHNINLVTPTHWTAHIVRAVSIAAARGLTVPLVWNTSGYERVEILRLLEGIVDIYLPDLKYGDDANALSLSGCENYFSTATAAISEMFRQVGLLEVDSEGIGVKGLIVRHMVLPQNLSGTPGVLSWIRENLGSEVSVALMNQYFPAWKAASSPPLDKPLSSEEYALQRETFFSLGFNNGWVQE